MRNYNMYDILSVRIEAAIREAGQIILEAKRVPGMINEKEKRYQFVTKHNVMVQEKLRELLLKILPDARFMGADDDVREKTGNGYCFIVDAIDGTTNFIKDYRASAISVGLTWKGKMYYGAVYNPYLDEMYTAMRDKGAFLNGKPIRVSKEPLSMGLVLFGSSPYHPELLKESFDMAYEYAQKALDIRRSGSAALDLCSIAAGRAELYFELHLNPWDYAAGTLIVQEAGGIVTQIDGSAFSFDGPCSILAKNKQ